MNNYNADSIYVLSDIMHIRERSGMYIGSGEDPRQLFSEILDNAVDEVQNGYGDSIDIIVDTENNVYTVRDYGRGIPHGTKVLESGEEKEVIEILLTKSNSGGKFNNEAYNHSGGLHGLGITITNALSHYIDVTSYRKGKFVHGHSEGGQNTFIEKGKTIEKDGTLVVFKPDETFFTTTHIPLSFIIDRCKLNCALKDVKTHLVVDGQEYSTSKDFYELIDIENLTEYCKSDIFDIISQSGEELKAGIIYTSDTKDKYCAFTNMLPNAFGGSHVVALQNAIIESWEEFLNAHRNLKPDVDLKRNDYLVGSRTICAVFIEHPNFSSQTKEKLDLKDKHYFDELTTMFKKKFKKWLEENVLQTQSLIKRFEEYRASQNSLLSRKEITSLIKVNEDSSDNIRRRSVVSKLVECTSRSRKDTELFIVEGDSAKGPYLSVRNKETQAILPLKGKGKNVTNLSIKEALQNNEIVDTVNACGCGLGDNCNADKSRYERIIISADADPDGAQISCLVLSEFVNLMPDMVKKGRVYLSVPPLYCWGTSPKDYGWTNDMNKVPQGVKNLSHFKGLGEMNDDQLEYFLVNKNTRNLIQVQYPSDINKFNEIMGTSEGKYELLAGLGILM